jgi:hypothetical protein
MAPSFTVSVSTVTSEDVQTACEKKSYHHYLVRLLICESMSSAAFTARELQGPLRNDHVDHLFHDADIEFSTFPSRSVRCRFRRERQYGISEAVVDLNRFPPRAFKPAGFAKLASWWPTDWLACNGSIIVPSFPIVMES